MDCRYSRRRIKDETDLVVCVVLWRGRVIDSWGGDPVVINIISLSGYREDPPEMERIPILGQRSIGNVRSTYQVAFRGGSDAEGDADLWMAFASMRYSLCSQSTGS